MPSYVRLPAALLSILSVCSSASFLSQTALAAPDAGTARPLIEMSETSKDGGAVEEGTVVEYQFTIRNRGRAELEIQQVKTSCGCSVAKWEKVVKPGATSVIEAQMHTEYFRGPVSKHLTVLSNDPVHPQLELTISAQVSPLVWIKPGPAAALAVADRAVTQEFVLERNAGRPMKILHVTSSVPYVTAEAAPLPGQGRFMVKVTATPDAPLGRSSVPVTVQTDLEKAGTITLQLTVDKGIVTTPPMLFYGLLPNEIKAPVQAAVTLTRPSPPFHIKSLSIDDPRLASRLETIREGAEYRVTVTYGGGWDAGLRKQMLTVMTDDPIQPTLRIPIQAVIQLPSTNLPSVVTH